MDENNQYGNTMTKPLPYGCIKRQEKISKINIGHLFLVDIKFHKMNEKTLLFNELYTLLFEKNKLLNPYKRSVLQLLSAISRDKEKDIINTFKHNEKTYSTMKEKNSSLYMQSIYIFW